MNETSRSAGALRELSPLEAHAMLVLLAAQVFLAPALVESDGTTPGLALHALYQSILIGLLLSVATRRWLLVGCLGLVVGSIVVRSAGVVPPSDRAWVADTLSGLSIAVVLTQSIRRFFAGSRVTVALISISVSLYFLAGILWTFAYGVLEEIRPGSFAGPGVEGAATRVDLHYFSYVTMTTLGYGDIAPVTTTARSLALSQAVYGQMFVAIVLGRLVGLHIAGERESGPQASVAGGGGLDG